MNSEEINAFLSSPPNEGEPFLLEALSEKNSMQTTTTGSGLSLNDGGETVEARLLL